ncbi:MAG: hypothetical protein CML03_06395 [Pseudooceanicola sp.]|nr:hypothetical protein [Pseudooceanicola sp.]
MTRIKSLIIGSAIVVTAGAGAAFAGSATTGPADPVIAAPVLPVVRASDWTGFYFGAGVGTGEWDRGAASGSGRNEGVFVGYDYDFGNYVLGGEAQYIGNDVVIGGQALQGVTRVKAKAGYDAGRALVYTTAGYAYADSSAGGGNGYVAGVGLDYEVMDNVTVGAEYLYNEFDDIGGQNLTGNTIEARLSYRF